jgi:Fe-S cluster assembly protein SufB
MSKKKCLQVLPWTLCRLFRSYNIQKNPTEKGIIFCPISEAIQEHPELVKKYLGTVSHNVIIITHNAAFSDGSFCYIPKGVRCPMELSTYFRINQAGLDNSREHW